MISVPVMSLGIRSGVNWMRLNFRCRAWARVETVSVLASPGTPIDQAVAAGEQADQHLLDHLLLTDDDLVNFAPEQLAGALHARTRCTASSGLVLTGAGWGWVDIPNGSWSRIRSPKTASSPAAPGVGRGQPSSPTASGSLS